MTTMHGAPFEMFNLSIHAACESVAPPVETSLLGCISKKISSLRARLVTLDGLLR